MTVGRSETSEMVEYARRFLNEHVAAGVFGRAAEGQPDAEETIVRAVLDACAAWKRNVLDRGQSGQ